MDVHFFRFLVLSLLSSFSLFSMPPTSEQKLIILRHGEATNNTNKVYNSNPENPNYKPASLTSKGKRQIQQIARNLHAQGFNQNNIAVVLISPLPRTKESAEILVEQGIVSKDQVIEDPRLIEMQAGDLEGKPLFPAWKPTFADQYHTETQEQIKKRIEDFYASILKQYPKGNIIVITHAIPAQDLIELITRRKVVLNPGESKVIPLRK